jgi:hypothetical protein
MEAIQPFGSGVTSDIPVQKFMGATVSRFDCTSDFASQPGSCNITLIGDDADGDSFQPGVIGSPQYFTIIDSDDNVVFGFNGVLGSIARDTSAGDKTYKVEIVSPLRILEAVTVIVDGYTGYGTAIEGLPRLFSDDGYYQISEDDQQDGYLPDGVTMTPSVDYFELTNFAFGNNNSNLNSTGMWGRVFNLQNVFAAYENEWVSAQGPVAVTPYNGFGASSSVKGGMRLDKVAYALDQLINYTTPSSPRRYIGGNILYGTNTYNICGTASGYVPPFPYFYGFDIIGFVKYALNYVPEDFVIHGPSITLAELVAQVCDAINADFIVELNDSTYRNGEFYAEMQQTYPNSIFGGIISVVLIPRNEYVDCDQPFSNFTYDLINLERPDMGDFGFAGNVNPGDSTGANNPLDLDFANVGTEGSYPFGGKFPVGTPSDSRGTTFSGQQATNISVSLKATPGTVGKMVVGGYQSRMNVVPRDFIYHYWGEICVVNESSNSCGATGQSKKSIPVITQLLPPNDTWDWIAIDMQDLFGAKNQTGVLYAGVYFASMMEIRAALVSYQAWVNYIYTFKKVKSYIIESNLFDRLQDRLLTKYVGKVKRYLGLKKLEQNVNRPKNDASDRIRTPQISNLMYDRIKQIADRHYGKSWIAPVPVCKSKTTSSEESLVGNFERSWEISDSAYVEPYAFSTLEAPKDSLFMDGGRLRPYVNFEHSFIGGTGNIGYDPITLTMLGTISGVQYKYDFSECGEDVVFDYLASGDCSPTGLAHMSTSIDNRYLYVPPEYFAYYNRGHCPFMDYQNGSMVTYSYEYNSKGAYDVPDRIGKIVNSYINDPNDTVIFNSNVTNTILSYETNGRKDMLFQPCESGMFLPGLCDWFEGYPILANGNLNVSTNEELVTDDYDDYFSWTHSGTALYTILEGLLDNPANDSGSGLPFVRFETSRVYYPGTLNAAGVDPISQEYLDTLESEIVDKFKSNAIGNLSTDSFTLGKNSVAKPCVAPRSVGIPQQSTRYVYGPWITNFTNIIYGGKFEFEKDEELVPENFLIPVYGNTDVNWNITDADGNIVRVLDSINGTVLSGMAGLNLAGQAIANSIDDFSLFAQEEGNVTIKGLPLITKLGEYLLNGPRITDINISFNAGQVETTYNFRSLSPRYGKSERELLKRLRKVSETIRRMG